MSQRFLFKLTAIIASTLMLTLVFLPFVAAAFALKQGAWKYGYTFLELSWKSNLLVALAIGMSLAVWNAFEFERHRTVDLKQYLKPGQRYHFNTTRPVDMEQLRPAIEDGIVRKGWTVRRWLDGGVELLRRNYLMKDVVKIKIIPNGMEISSRPKWGILLVDMARNLSNVEDVSRRLKQLR